jgi:DNA-binding transcriptional LysR family regulator
MNDVNLRHLHAFITVGKLSSFTRAANQLNLSQPALTVQIRQLEETLGVRLLDRNTRSVRLTDVGKDLVPVVERLLHEIDSVILNTQELVTKNKGLVRIAAIPSIAANLLPRVIARFRKDHPEINIRLKDDVPQRMLSLIKSDAVDFGIGDLARMDPDLQFTALFQDRIHVVFPAGHALDQKNDLRLEDLAGHPLILTEPDSNLRALVDHAFQSIGSSAAPVYEATYLSTVVGMVLADLGIAILPASILGLRALSGLCARAIDHPPLAREIGLIQKSGATTSTAAESFLTFVKVLCADAQGNIEALFE